VSGNELKYAARLASMRCNSRRSILVGMAGYGLARLAVRVFIMQAPTVVSWHRKGFRLFIMASSPAREKKVSDDIYGVGTRYASKERLRAMLECEHLACAGPTQSGSRQRYTLCGTPNLLVAYRRGCPMLWQMHQMEWDF
jgi:hypothetical protein